MPAALEVRVSCFWREFRLHPSDAIIRYALRKTDSRAIGAPGWFKTLVREFGGKLFNRGAVLKQHTDGNSPTVAKAVKGAAGLIASNEHLARPAVVIQANSHKEFNTAFV